MFLVNIPVYVSSVAVAAGGYMVSIRKKDITKESTSGDTEEYQEEKIKTMILGTKKNTNIPQALAVTNMSVSYINMQPWKQ